MAPPADDATDSVSQPADRYAQAKEWFRMMWFRMMRCKGVREVLAVCGDLLAWWLGAHSGLYLKIVGFFLYMYYESSMSQWTGLLVWYLMRLRLRPRLALPLENDNGTGVSSTSSSVV